MKKAIKGKNIDGDKKNSKGNKKKKFKKAVILFVIWDSSYWDAVC